MDALRLAPDAARLPAMTGEDAGRGAEIKRRYDALGISDREWMSETGIDIKTVKRAIADEPGTRPGSYLAIESALDKLEAAVAGKATPGQVGTGAEAGLVEFRLSGNFGVDVVVKGPITDREALEESVKHLIREMRRD